MCGSGRAGHLAGTGIAYESRPVILGKVDAQQITGAAIISRYGGTQAVMAVSGRVAADALGNRVIRELGFSVQARPVTTLGAVAFRAISASREGKILPNPTKNRTLDGIL